MKPDLFEELASRMYYELHLNLVDENVPADDLINAVTNWLRSNAQDIGAAWYQWENEPIDDVNWDRGIL